MYLIDSILLSFKRELREVVNNRLYRAVMFIIPSVMILFFTVMFYSGEITNLPIVVVDKSHSPMSRQLLEMMDATRGVEVAFEVESIAEAERLMLDGDAVAIVYIPDSFEADIYGGVVAKVECYTLGTNISAEGVISENIQQVIMTFSAGISLNKLQSMGVGYSEAMVEIMPINIHSNIVANPYLNYGYYLAPLFMFMGVVILTIVATTYALGRELRYATASEWLQTANGSLLAAVIGKLLPVTIVMSIMVQVILFVLIVVMGMQCAGNYLILTLGSVIFVLAYQSVAIFIVSLTSNLRLALSLGGGYAVMAFTFSGLTFPVTAMFEWIQPISKLFPLGYFSDIFIDQMMLGVPIYYDISKLCAMAVFFILPFVIWRRLSRVVADKQYWERG